MWQKIFWFVFALALPLLVGFAASVISSQSFEIYTQLHRPPFSPPAAVFGPVWSVLYLCMGLASYCVMAAPVPRSRRIWPLIVYGVQLAVNFWWTYFFFVLQWRFFAFVWILFLFALLLYCSWLFQKISRLSFFLFIPYVLWVIFAAYLNIGLYVLNM